MRHVACLRDMDITRALNCILPESHPPEDVVEVAGGEEPLVLGVEHVEADLEHLDLVRLQTRHVLDLVKVDPLEGLLLLGRHGDFGGGGGSWSLA